jgi:hypothetical protein
MAHALDGQRAIPSYPVDKSVDKLCKTIAEGVEKAVDTSRK